MSSELSPSSGEFSFVSRGLVRAMALARMVASSASHSSVVSVSAGGAKAMSSGTADKLHKKFAQTVSATGGDINQKRWVPEFLRNAARMMVFGVSDLQLFRRRSPQAHHPLAGIT